MMQPGWHLPLMALLWLAAASEGVHADEVCPARIDPPGQPDGDSRAGWRLYESQGRSSNLHLADVAFFGTAPRSGQVQEVLAPVATRRAGNGLHSTYAFAPSGTRVWVGCTYRDGEAFARFAHQLAPVLCCEVDREGSRVTHNACTLAPIPPATPLVTPLGRLTGQGLELGFDRGALYVVNRTGKLLHYSGNFVSGAPLPDGDLVLHVETLDGKSVRPCVIVDQFGPTQTLDAGARASLQHAARELGELFCFAAETDYRISLQFVRWTPREEIVVWSSNHLTLLGSP